MTEAVIPSPSDGGFRVGIDTGGTFTDVVVIDGRSGSVTKAKTPSTPWNPAEAILAALEDLLATGALDPAQIGFFAHGTTVATNALLQGKLAKTGLITTAGFRDVLEIGTGQRPDLWDMSTQRPEPLVSRPLRMEVEERVDRRGGIVRGLDTDAARRAVLSLAAKDVQAVAVALLFSFANGEHEQRVREIVRELAPHVYVCISSEVSPEFREYPRTSTAVINACVAPVVAGYLADLSKGVGELGPSVPVHVMQSNGGLMTTSQAVAASAHRLFLSGPAAGAAGAAYVAGLAGHGDVITMDMGGTSCDVGIVLGGQPRTRHETLVNDWFPLSTEIVDLHTIGAGGGSIAWVDGGGMLHVGPQSAGARPGPACYGLGGDRPTLTDAHVVLGRLHPDHFLGGRMRLDTDKASHAVEALGKDLGMTPVEAAQAIVRTANNNMVGAIRVVSTARGYDPRDFALVPFGGAGGLHAAELAEEIGIPTVLVPEIPGLLSAFGLLASDIKHDFAVTNVAAADAIDHQAVTRVLRDLEKRALQLLGDEGIAEPDRIVQFCADMRYLGQAHTLTVPLANAELTKAAAAAAAAAFHEIHHRLYGQSAPGEPVEFVNFRVQCTGAVARPELASIGAGGRDPSPAWLFDTEIVLGSSNGRVKVPLYERTALRPGNRLEGPAMITQLDATTLILPAQHATVDQRCNLLIDARPHEVSDGL